MTTRGPVNKLNSSFMMKCMPNGLAVLMLAVAGRLAVMEPSLSAQPEDTSEPEGGETPAVTSDVSPEVMRSFLHLQEQIYAAQMAIEKGRLEAEAAEARNTEALNARLQVIERALDQAQSDHNAALLQASQQIQDSNRQIMIFAGVFASLGFLAIALTGWIQWKTAFRLSTLPLSGTLPLLPSASGSGVLGFDRASRQAPTVQLMEALGRLEHRIADLEVGNRASLRPHDDGRTGLSGELASLIKEGEELLAHEEAEKAIEHFEAVLAKHPGHPEVLLRKGAALERLGRDQEAIECYDEAIRADRNLTMAYLHKGGLYNRMERFNEAMECYEQALKVQEGRTTVS